MFQSLGYRKLRTRRIVGRLSASVHRPGWVLDDRWEHNSLARCRYIRRRWRSPTPTKDREPKITEGRNPRRKLHRHSLGRGTARSGNTVNNDFELARTVANSTFIQSPHRCRRGGSAAGRCRRSLTLCSLTRGTVRKSWGQKDCRRPNVKEKKMAPR